MGIYCPWMLIPEVGSPGLVWQLRDVSGTQVLFMFPSVHPWWQAFIFTEKSGGRGWNEAQTGCEEH